MAWAIYEKVKNARPDPIRHAEFLHGGWLMKGCFRYSAQPAAACQATAENVSF
jgi:hypothetical protein